jgi:phospholipid N-methyltransferase
MYIYNVTTNIDESLHDSWLKWMQEKHIPDMLATGKFTKALLSKVLVNEEMGGITYSTQYTCASREILDMYYKEDATKLRTEALEKFGNKFGAFRTEMEITKEFNN